MQACWYFKPKKELKVKEYEDKETERKPILKAKSHNTPFPALSL